MGIRGSGEGIKRGSWTAEEDHKLKAYIESHGEGGWRSLPAKAGLERCGKSCRLRWTNYLKPGIKRGSFTPQEDQTIIKLHAHLGNRWAAIARQLPMRTDNEIKNYWNAHLKKRVAAGGGDVETAPPAKKAAVSSSAEILNRLATRVTLLDMKTCLAIITHQWVPDNNNNSSSTTSTTTREEEESRNDDEEQCSKNDKEEGAELKNESSRSGNCIALAASAGDDDDDSSNKAAADQWGLLLLDSEVAGFPEFGDPMMMMMMMTGSPFSDSRFLEEKEEDLSTPPPPTP